MRGYVDRAWLLCEGGEIEVEAELFVQDTPLGISWHGTLLGRGSTGSRSPHRPTSSPYARSTARWGRCA